MNFKNSRYVGAILIIPFVLLIITGGVWFGLAVSLLSIFALKEMITALEDNSDIVVPKRALYFFHIALIFSTNMSICFIVGIVSVLSILCTPIFFKKYSIKDISISILIYLYISVPFKMLLSIAFLNKGYWIIIFIFCLSWISDTAAYYTGRLFGKHKLCPRISPNKTIEGALGGLLASILVSCAFVLINTDYSCYGATLVILTCLIGLLLGSLSQLGDLVASFIKRSFGVKDYSNLLPGHGGILDRFDSILFSTIGIVLILLIRAVIGY